LERSADGVARTLRVGRITVREGFTLTSERAEALIYTTLVKDKG
jgi:hypothetical protein